MIGLRSSQNLEKMLKIFLYPILSTLDCDIASTYIDLLSLLAFEPTSQMY